MNEEKEPKKTRQRKTTASDTKKTTTKKSATTKKSTTKKTTTTKKSSPTKKSTTKSPTTKKTTKKSLEEVKEPKTTKTKTSKTATTGTKKATTTKKTEEPIKKSKILISEEVNQEPLVGRELSQEEIKEYLSDDLERTIIIDGEQVKNIQEVAQNLNNSTIYKDDKITKRSSLKKSLIILLSVVIVFIIIATTIYVVKNIDNKPTNNSDNIYDIALKATKDKDLSSSAEIENTDYDHIKEINLDSLEKYILERKKFNLVIFSKTCFACAQYEPVLEEILKDRDETIYRIDVTKLSKEEIIELRNYYAYEKTPTIINIDNGRLTSTLIGVKKSDELTKWLDEK